MYLLLVLIPLLLSSGPARSRPVEDLIERISKKTGGNFTKKGNLQVSSIIETSKLEEQKADEPVILFGDIAFPRGLENADQCTARGCKWDRSRDKLVYVPYQISRAYSPREVSVIKQALESFAQVSCIRFVPHTGERNFLNIKSASGCYSYLGRVGGGQVVSLQRQGCVYFSTVQHELLHALGFHHEQNRSDRDKHIRILYQNIMPAQQYNFNRQNTNNLGTPYDYSSVMQYSRYAFSMNNQPTMVPVPNANVVLGEARSMSANDILRINRLYCS